MIYISDRIFREQPMQVAKWGNSLAIRLPAAVVEALKLKEGDEIEIHVAGERAFDVRRDRSRERALNRLRALRKPLPPGWTFDREDANAR
jgi:antitoxin MazE